MLLFVRTRHDPSEFLRYWRLQYLPSVGLSLILNLTFDKNLYKSKPFFGFIVGCCLFLKMQNPKLLILSSVWVEPKSSAAGTRMLQLIRFFQKYGYEIEYASTAAVS